MKWNLAQCLEIAWNKVASLYIKGLIPNENPCNFSFCTSILEGLPDGFHLTYDNITEIVVPGYKKKDVRPDLLIWAENEDPVVVFVGEMKFWPHYPGEKRKVIEDLKKLAHLLKQNEISTIKLNPKSGAYDRGCKARITDKTQIGYFITARGEFADHGFIRKEFGEIDKGSVGRLHTGIGRVYDDRDPRFSYLNPSS